MPWDEDPRDERIRELEAEVARLRTWVIRLTPGAEERIAAALACECEEPLPLEEFLARTDPVVHVEGCPMGADSGKGGE